MDVEEEIGVAGWPEKLKRFEPNKAAALLGVDCAQVGQVKSLYG